MTNTELTENARTYRNSVLLLMIRAMQRLYGNDAVSNLFVEFSLDKGVFCTMRNMQTVPEDFCEKVKAEMKRLSDLALPVVKKVIHVSDAADYFAALGLPKKSRLFDYRRGSLTSVYELEGLQDYFYGHILDNTADVRSFDLFPYHEGLILLLPDKRNPEKPLEFHSQEKLFRTLYESSRWSSRLGIETASDLNDRIVSGNITQMILTQEAIFEQKLGDIAELIASREQVKFCMIAGPSSSGKTTFSNRLSVQLTAHGLKPHPISLDNYYLNRDETPLGEDGKPDFECLEALDVKLFNEQMLKLLNGETVELPVFNFKTGKREYNGNFLKLGKEDILVIEGIHGLNDALSYALPRENKFKIYLSALTQLNVDEHNCIPTTDGRLLRRIVRDARTRGTSAAKTISMWESVRKGEEKYIFPYQEDADVMFNSSMIYEFAALKVYAEPALFGITKDMPEYPEARRLLRFLDYFLNIPDDEIPGNSLVREFIGGGCFGI